MATYYIDETTPAQDSRQLSNINAGMDSMLQSLDRMEASRQRGRYYDYLNEIQKQKLGAAKAKDREDAHEQRAANKQNEILFNNARESLISAREALGKNLAYLDKEIGFGRYSGLTQEQMEDRIALEQERMQEGTGLYTPAALTYPSQRPADRLEDYRKLLNDGTRWKDVQSGTATAMLFNKLREALSRADEAVEADTQLSSYLQKSIPGSRPIVGPDGITDFEFVPKRDQIKFFKNQYKENPFKGTSIEPGSADEADAATYGQDRAESPSSLPGGPLVGQEGYVTPLGPGGEGERFMAYRDPNPEGAGRGLTEREHVTPLESYPVPTGEISGGGLMPLDRRPADLEAGLSANQPFDPDGSGYDYETARAYGLEPDESGHWPSRVPETGQILKGVNHLTFGLTEQAEADAGNVITKGADGRYYSNQPNPYLEGIVNRNAFGLDRSLPAVDGNRPIRLDQLEGPVSGDATVTEGQARTPEYLQEGFRIPDSSYQPRYDKMSDFEKAMYIDERSVVPEGDSPLMDRVPPWERDSQPSYSIPYKDPRFEAQLGFVDTGTGKYIPPFDRGPLVDRSFPEMGRVNDADYPTSLEGDIVELKTMDGPVLMRRLNSPLMNKQGYFPSMQEVLPELRSPSDYEPYPGNPLYLPGGPLYEEEE